MNSFVLAHRQRIDALFGRVSSFSSPADQGEWSKYLCVLVSGYFEYLIKSCNRPELSMQRGARVRLVLNHKWIRPPAIRQRVE